MAGCSDWLRPAWAGLTVRKKRLTLLAVLLCLALPLYSNVQHIVWLKLLVSDPALPAPANITGMERFWGGVEFGRGNYQESIAYLERVQRLTALPTDRLARDILFRSYAATGSYADAAIVAQSAGQLRLFEKEGVSPELRTSAPLAHRHALQLTYLRLSESALDRQDADVALTNAQQAYRLTPDSALNGNALYVLARAYALKDDLRLALTYVRLSGNVLPWKGWTDGRIGFASRIVAVMSQRDGCQAQTERVQLALLTLYLGERTRTVDAICAERMWQSALQLSSPPYRPYLHLLAARLAIAQGDLTRATLAFHRAESAGLSLAWQSALLSQQSMQVPTEAVPTFPVNDRNLVGFDIDLIAYDLGLPMSVILYERAANKVQLGAYEVINLAPTIFGREDGLSECDRVDCLAESYSQEMYGAPRSAYTTQTIKRPAWPSDPDTHGGIALVLDNTSSARTGLSTFDRYAPPNTRFLQAAWARSIAGKAYIGRRFREGDQPGDYDYVLTDYADDRWIFATEVIESPAQSASVELWQLNFDTRGQALFSGALMFQLPNRRK